VKQQEPFILAFADIRATDLPLVGGKGANLGEDPSEIDIKMPRWYEEPLPLLQVIAKYLQKEAGSHRTQHEKLVLAREAAVSSLLKSARHGFWGRLRRRYEPHMEQSMVLAVLVQLLSLLLLST